MKIIKASSSAIFSFGYKQKISLGTLLYIEDIQTLLIFKDDRIGLFLLLGFFWKSFDMCLIFLF